MQNGARGAGGTAGVHARILRGHPISPERQHKPVVTLQRSINKCLGKSMKVSKAPAQREAQGGQWEVEMLQSSGWQQDTKGEMCRGRLGSLHLVGPHKAVGQEGCSLNLQRHPYFSKILYVFSPCLILGEDQQPGKGLDFLQCDFQCMSHPYNLQTWTMSG